MRTRRHSGMTLLDSSLDDTESDDGLQDFDGLEEFNLNYEIGLESDLGQINMENFRARYSNDHW
jgi:hypothetical protein